MYVVVDIIFLGGCNCYSTHILIFMLILFILLAHVVLQERMTIARIKFKKTVTVWFCLQQIDSRSDWNGIAVCIDYGYVRGSVSIARSETSPIVIRIMCNVGYACPEREGFAS